jgi:type I restriction enzyme, S subunit
MSPDALALAELQAGSEIPKAPGLPVGWAWATLGEILPLEYGKALPERVRDSTGKVAVYGSSGRLGWHNAAMVAGPTLIVGRKGSAGAVFYCDEDCWPIDTVYFVEPKCVIDLRYGFYFLKWKSLGRLDQSTAIPSLSRDIYSDVRIPLAPLPEQRRIVARIDELFAEIAEGEAALERARQGLDTWRRALLKAAVTGELTRDWREANRPTETGGDTVIITRDGRLDTLGPYAIPSGWIWTTIGQAGQVLLGRQRAPQHHSGPHMRPYLRVANVLEDRIDTSDVKFMNFTPAEFNKYHLQSGDILLNEGQSSDLVGRSAIYRGEIEGCCFQKTLLRFRASEAVIPEYAQIVFLHYLHSKRFRRAAPITTNMAHLTLERLLTIEFPLPPRKEQQFIVHRSREMGDTIEDMDSTIGDRDRDALRQSVLKAAFEGRLVPQDPADQPASALLARLRNGHPGNGARRRRARTAADFSHPSLPGLTLSVDPRVEPAGEG